MVNFNASIPKILKTFLKNFQTTFSKPAFISFCIYVNGLFLLLKRTNIEAISLFTPSAKYQNIQYFLSEAKWNHEELNEQRIKMLQGNRTTKTSKKGVLVLDDSGCKKWGLKTEGAQIQHYGTEGIQTRCNVVVASAFVDTRKRYPINFRPYVPENDTFFDNHFTAFKSKIDLAKELVEDAISKNLSFSDIVFDSWYLSNSFIDFLQSKHLTFISEVPVDRLISFRGKWIRAGELVKLIPMHKFKHLVTVPNANNEKRSFYTYCFKSKLKGVNGNFLFVVSIGSWNNSDPKNVHVFASNHLSLSPHKLLQNYALRWGIECIFRDLKDHLNFDHYQVRSIHAINRHWHLVALAYSFLLICSLNGSFSRTFYQKPSSCGHQLELFRKLKSITQLDWIKLNYQRYQNYLGTKKPFRQDA